MSFLQHYWWAIVFSAIIAWWASGLWRGAKRLSTPPPAVQSPPLRTAFTRSEFEGKVGLVRKRIWMGVGAGLGIFVIGTLTLIVLGQAVPSIPQGDLEAAQLLVIVAALLSLFGFIIADTRLIRRLGLICPVCRAG